MTEGTDTPTDGLAAEAPAESKTSQPVAAEEATPVIETEKDTAETDKPEGDKPAGEDESDVEKPKRRSGYERMKRRALMAEAELANARLKSLDAPETKSDDKAPREEDFGGDWGKFVAATAAYEASKAVKETLRADKQETLKDRASGIQREVMADFEERAEAYKATAKDFDEVVGKFVQGGGKFADHVRDLVVDSDKGPELAYFLAKNPSKAIELNTMSPLRAAREIGALETTLSRPPTKATRATPPVSAPKGGTAPPQDQNSILDAWMKKTYGKDA